MFIDGVNSSQSLTVILLPSSLIPGKNVWLRFPAAGGTFSQAKLAFASDAKSVSVSNLNGLDAIRFYGVY